MNRLYFPLLIVLVAAGCSKPRPPVAAAPAAGSAASASAAGSAASAPTPAAQSPYAQLKRAKTIEVATAPSAKKPWMKELDASDRKTLFDAIDGATISDAVPKCVPSVIVTFLDEDRKTIGTLSAFCTDEPSPITIHVGRTLGAITVKDWALFRSALESPVDI